MAILANELPHQSQCGSLVPARLHQTIEYLAFRIDCSPQIHPLATNRDEHLIEMPDSMRLGAHRPQPSGDHRPEHRHPAPDGLVRDVDTALGQQFFHVSETERETKIEPDSVLHDFRWEAVTGVRQRSHYARLRLPKSAGND